MTEVLYKIHWLSFTIHGSIDDSIVLHDNLFRDIFGDLQSLGHGGRGFKEIQRGMFEYKIYSQPISNNAEYFHVEIPGIACEALNWDYFKALYEYLEGNFQERYKFKRLDFAFDHLKFTPNDVESAFKNEQIRSLAKRDTLIIHETPYGEKDNGEKGTKTVQFGSRQSERMIRIYDKRGFTRLEIETKDKRAHTIAIDLLQVDSDDKWFRIAVSHLRDFIDFKTDWWDAFVCGQARANRIVTIPNEVNLQRLKSWYVKQVAPAASVLVDTLPYGDMDHILAIGRYRRKDKYNLIIENAGGHPGKVPTPRKGTQGGTSVFPEDQV